jgi:hypothetical protein
MLAETLSLKGKTIETIAAYAQQYMDEHWQETWQQHLPEIRRVYQKAGEPAYGVYARKLFSPLEAELEQAGLTCEQSLPGQFPLSREQGPQEKRERRFWTMIRQEDGEALGTLLTHYYHDHTQLRIPQAPKMLPLAETEAAAVEQALVHGW